MGKVLFGNRSGCAGREQAAYLLEFFLCGSTPARFEWII
jgi:hypothetical protein